MNKYNLGGHSGCRIFLMEDDNGKNYVRKISKDKEYNHRLKSQSEKQAAFSGDPIRAPKVLNQGYTEEGLYFFDMEYIQGVTLAEYIKTMEIGKVKGLVEALVSSLVSRNKTSISEEQQKLARDVFKKKLSNLREKLSDNNEVVNHALDLLEKHNWSKLAPTQCHGDMTLENIIIKDERMYFIDFLDSFYDSWFLDIGTLLQDVQVMWSYRFQKEVSMNTVLRLIVFRDLLLDEIKENCYDILNQFGLVDLFDLILTHDDITKSKPDPEGFLKAMDYFDAKPTETIIFEDSEVGLEAAEKSGAYYYKTYRFN